MKKTSLLFIVIVVILSLKGVCTSRQKDESENGCQKPKSIAVGIDKSSVESEAISEDTDFDSQINNIDMGIDYGVLMAQAIANEDYGQAMLYEDMKNKKNESQDLKDNLNYDDLLLLAKIVYAEAGSSWLTDEHRLLVASVVVNRINSPEFPDTLYEVVYQEGQYAPVEKEWFDDLIPTESSVMAAYTILTEGSIAPIDVVYQANFKQGSELYKSIRDDKLGTTYFCYSENRNLYK